MVTKLTLIGIGFIIVTSISVPPASAGLSELAQAQESSPPGVSVPTSSAASELFTKARQKESEKQWDEADELYEQILNQFESKVVTTGLDSQNKMYHYQGICLAIQHNISKWPREGLEIYNANHEKSLSTGNLDASEIFSRYFSSNAGKEAGIRLLDREMERGDFYTAQWTGNRLLSLHPSLGSDRPMIVFRTAMAYHWAGDDPAAKALSDQLLKLAPDVKDLIGGKMITLSTELPKLIQIHAELPSELSKTSEYHSSLGETGLSRARLIPSPKIGRLLNCITLESPNYAIVSPGQLSLYQNLDESELAADLLTQIMPASQGGDIFFQDGRNLYAIDGETGKTSPAWSGTYAGSQGGHYAVPAFGRVRNQQLTVMVTPKVVLAVMGQKDTGSITTGRGNTSDLPGQSAATLVCLDRATGAQRWTRSPAEFPQAVEPLRAGEFSGTPIVYHSLDGDRGDSVLIAIHSSKSNGFDECHIVSLSLTTGEYQWSTYAGGAVSESRQAGEPRIDKPSQIAVSQGRVLVMTNRGCIASIDAESGRIVWMYAYQPQYKPSNNHQRDIHKYGAQYDALEQGPRAWTHNPIFISQGKIFALPADANSLYILDLNSGEGQQVSMGQFKDAAVCLGVRDESICIATDYDIFLIDWKKLYENANSTPVLWSEISFTGNEANPICGRGYWSGEEIWIPTRERLYELSSGKQRITSVYTLKNELGSQEGAGNWLVTSRNIIIAQPRQICLYTHDAGSN